MVALLWELFQGPWSLRPLALQTCNMITPQQLMWKLLVCRQDMISAEWKVPLYPWDTMGGTSDKSLEWEGWLPLSVSQESERL